MAIMEGGKEEERVQLRGMSDRGKSAWVGLLPEGPPDGLTAVLASPVTF